MMLQVTMKQLNNGTVAETKYFIKYNTNFLTFLNNKNNTKYSLMAGNIYINYINLPAIVVAKIIILDPGSVS